MGTKKCQLSIREPSRAPGSPDGSFEIIGPPPAECSKVQRGKSREALLDIYHVLL